MSHIRWVAFQPLAGGMALGAEQAFGCPPEFVIDYDGVTNSDAYVYYMNSVRGVGIKHLVLDGGLLSGSTSFASTDDESYFNENCQGIDVVVSVPICSGLSVCTVSSARGGDASRNDNMLNITKFVVSKMSPKVFIFENAPALCSNSGSVVREKLEREAKSFGYSVTYIKTDSRLHENVQYRERTFVIFWKGTRCPQMSYVDNPAGSISDYLSKISPDAKYNTEEYCLFPDFNGNGFIKYLKKKYGDDFTSKWPSDKIRSVSNLIEHYNDFELAKSVMDEKECEFMDHIIFKRLQNKNYFDGSPVYYGEYKVPVVFGRYYERLVHPSGKRGYTVREFMRFMGLPDDYDFPDVMKHIHYIGQNVPVVTARDWCIQIREYLEGKRKITLKTVDMFNNIKKSDISLTMAGAFKF